MAKPFRLSVSVEEHALGRVMAVLHKTPGVVRVDLELGDAPSAKSAKSNGAEPHEKKARKTRFVDPTGATGRDIVMKVLAKAKAPVTKGGFEQAFVESGRAGSSYGSVVYGLQNEGVVQNKGDGYSLTKKGRDRARYVK
jgi:hypothetical protein